MTPSAMKSTNGSTVCILIFAVTLLTPRVGIAEWFGDIYLGASHTKASNNRFQVNGAPVRDLEDADISTPFGGRLGYWFQSHPWLGVAVDVSVFTPDFDDATSPALPGSPVTITVAPISGLLMLRLPLQKSEEFPKGRFQPYLGGGPGLFFTSMSEFAGDAVPPPAVLEDSSLGLGFDARAGLTGLISKQFGLFVEYRYTQIHPELESSTGGGTVKYEPTFRTHHVVLGVTFRFGGQ